MRTTILLTILVSGVIGYFLGANSPNRTNIPLKPVIEPDTYVIDYLTIKRIAEDGQPNHYSIWLSTSHEPDYGEITLTQLDSVLSGYKLSGEKK